MIALTPKSRFQKGPAVKFHQDLVIRPEFHEALQTAFAYFSMTHGVTQDHLIGARAFINDFLNLAEPPEKEDSDALAHNLWQNQAPSQPIPRAQLLEKSKAQRHPKF